MGTENQTKKKRKRKQKNTILCKKGNYISSASLGTKFNCSEAETISLFYLKFIVAKS